MARAPAGPVPVVVMGLGFIGQEIAKAALSSPEVELIGAVDTHAALVGRPLGDVLGGPAPRVKVVDSLEKAVGRRKGAVLLHATGSRLPQVMEQLLAALKLGLPVVSTCEELAFPYLKYPELADKLDEAAQRAEVSILGAGVNPGFVLDRLVATAGLVCGPVRRATVTRVVDARTRREALQRKVGAGLTEEEFFELVDGEQLGHVGLVESAALAALGLGLDCDDYEEEVAPVFAEEDILGGAFTVKKGRVAGMFQSVVGLEDGQERVRLELTIAMGADEPKDRIEIDAEPRLVLEIPGGVAGDRATANVLVNAAPRLTAAEAGLLTVLELPAGR
ncbi:dihydrodipicolinate reductase [Myxococcus stipitatus DSM 14675]|uniref:Dihydrodipicolinate reductase n=1 Tax=Myxococcus stipitatus (strain DSM 14675 / JCM 12634 / Mx s8) TaxID=1278073 RepID=L7UC00_MYXSD|nr:dihydrodipicolinate reductase [Myxococcus stipitatus]AGC46411.1 dihydrodipicolinate reductase [Myxococcus stipitatus DSM 14675]